MDEAFVLKVSEFSNKTENRRKIISFLGRISPYPIFVLYAVFSLVIIKSLTLGKAVFFLIPALTFAVVTFIRKRLNRKRPFELYDIPKLIPHGVGKGFPSRHSACAVTISLAIFTVSLRWGLVCLAFSVIVCVTRVLCGVHFVKDVIAGALSGFIPWAIYLIIMAYL